MFQLPPQIVLGCSNNKVVPKSSVPPTQHILQKSGADSAWTQRDGILYKIILVSSRRFSPMDVLTTDFFHHRAQSTPFKLQSAIGFSHYAPLMDIQI